MDTPTAQAVTTTNLGGAKTARSFSFYRNTTFISLLIGYAGYYLCRQNLSVAYGPMKDSLGLDPIAFGTISSIGTLMYAVGKITTGALADQRGGRAIFYLGLAGSVVASLIFGFGAGIGFFIALWSMNRFFQSMGWGGLVNVMSRWFPKSTYGTAMGVMSLNYQFGGVVASLFAGMLLSFGLGWQSLFFVPALTLAAIGIVSVPFLKNSPKDVGHELPTDPDSQTASASVAAEDLGLTYWSRFRLILSDRMFLVMCALSFVLTLLRECFNTWMPAYFTEMGAKASTAAFKSAVFPLLGCAGTIFAGWFSDRYLQGRRGPVMGVLMVGLAISLLGLGNLEAVAAWASVDKSTAALLLVGLSGFLLLGPYSLVAGVVALDFGGRKTAGTAAGLLDGVGYVGATLAGYGVASVVVARGWAYAYSIMSGLTLVGVLLCAFLWKVRPRD